MILNMDKTNCHLFTFNRQEFRLRLFYHGRQVTVKDRITYLGVVLDPKLNWGEHVRAIREKAEKRLPILKRLAGCKWGCGRDTLATTYKLYIKPFFNYCNEVLVTASDSTIKPLDIIQNQALRIITGAVKTTPILSMQLLTDLTSVKHDIDRDAGVLLQKLVRLPNNEYWRNYNYTSHRNLKTQQGFNQASFGVIQDLDVSQPPELLTGPWCFLDF